MPGPMISHCKRGFTLEQQQALDNFLSGVERRAFRMAHVATGNHDDALELVQDAMFKLVKQYRHRPETEWGPLFQRILQSRIQDWYRRSKVRHRWIDWFRPPASDEQAEDPIQTAPDPRGRTQTSILQGEETLQQLESAIRQLPLRQQQAFLLRSWEGLPVADTAHAMGCSEGSVKTHYSRAIATLRERLEGYWP
ncbi:RNA polymerase sigma factor [Sedimenticola selenatireducens]|nr:RNA polymerase sigma factor [Sedimenticola selenatireducens]